MDNQSYEKKQNDKLSSEMNTGTKVIKKISKKLMLLIVAIIVCVVIGVISFGAQLLSGKNPKEEIITTSALEKIINISELSTFQAVYNGITKVMNEEKPDKLDFYASYEAKVYAGFDFEKVDIITDEDAKKIIVTIPEIQITDVNVDIASLDFMFQNDKADASTVSERAYKACIEDVTIESEAEAEIYELAEQNAKNIIEALISPFIEQLDPEYELEIKGEV